MSATAADEQLEQLLEYLKDSRGFDFTGYKRPSLSRRIAKRMEEVGIESYAGYREYLARHPDEFALLLDTILINVTSFFRDPPLWEYLRAEIVPAILAAAPPGEPIRVWSAGCASGEEAYTAAIVLAEALGPGAFRERVKIYATDADEEALVEGRQAVYTSKQIASVPEELRERYFERVAGRFAFRAELRRSVVFGHHDVVQDPPISRIDLLIARNTLMYFDRETQARVLRSFHFALRPHGYLFLGKSEALLGHPDAFVPVDLRKRVFAPLPRSGLRDGLMRMVEHVGEPPHDDPGADADGRTELRELAFETSPLATVLVDPDGLVAAATREARRLFNLTSDDLGRPLQDLELSYRPVELRSRIDEVYESARPVVVGPVEVEVPGAATRVHELDISPIGRDPSRPLGVSITFTDVTVAAELERQLEGAYAALQSTVQELETTNEELQSTNEELETTNEELQSANEELETMNEELQSTNEELEALNEALALRSENLDEVNVFLEGVLASLGAGIAVLDSELRVRAWNGEAAELWGVRADEAEGRNFLDLDIGLPLEQIREPLREAAESGERRETLVEAVNRRGRTISCTVRFIRLENDEGAVRGTIVLMEPGTG